MTFGLDRDGVLFWFCDIDISFFFFFFFHILCVHFTHYTVSLEDDSNNDLFLFIIFHLSFLAEIQEITPQKLLIVTEAYGP